MNKKAWIFLFFVLCGLLVVFFPWPGLATHSKLSIPSQRSVKRSLIYDFHMEEGKQQLAMNFFFTQDVSYEAQYDPRRNLFELYFFNVSRRKMKRLIELNPDYFHKLQMSYNRSGIYKLAFFLQENVIPLPFDSAGRTQSLQLNFSGKYRNQLRLKVSQEIRSQKQEEQSNKSPRSAMGQFSASYKRPIIPTSRTGLELLDKVDDKVEEHVSHFRFKTSQPRNQGYGIKIHHSQLASRMQIALGEERLLGKDTVRKMSEENDAILGINGSFFLKNGDPVGLLIRDRRLLSAPKEVRSSFGVLQNGKAFIGRPKFEGEVVTAAGVLKIEGLNQMASNRNMETLLYTEEYGQKIPFDLERKYFLIRNHQAQKRVTSLETIPKDAFLLSVNVKTHPWVEKLKPLSKVVVSYGLTPPWNRAQLAIGGGPRLLRDGQFAWEEMEGFSENFYHSRAPRTAVGIDRFGNLILVVVDGRQTDSRGLTIPEMADLMDQLGAFQAVNLDGGGSSSMVLNGEVVNNPSDGKERKVSNALLLLKS